MLALRVIGVAALQRHDAAAAATALRSAARAAERAGLAEDAARIRVTLAAALALLGQSAAADREAERAATVLRGGDLARLAMQRGNLALHAGRPSDALGFYVQALPLFQEANDALGTTQVLANRGLAQLQLGQMAEAAAALAESREGFRSLGMRRCEADLVANLGFVAARAGDLPTALAYYDAAEELLDEGDIDPVAQRDRCEALLAAGLASEAVAVASRAIAALRARGARTYLAEAHLVLAQALLLAGEAGASRVAAERARAAFRRQHRLPWASAAAFVVVQARWAGGDRSRALADRARDLAPQLEQLGWWTGAADARLIAADILLGRKASEEAALVAADAARHRLEGPAPLRARGWLAHAVACLARGQRGEAQRALGRGMAVLERHQDSLGATELRAAVAAHAEAMATLGVRLALEDRSPRAIFAWAERWRAGALRQQPVRPPDDEAVGALLAELREVARTTLQVGGEGGDPAPHLARQQVLEVAIRRRTRLARGGDGAAGGRNVLRSVQAQLGGAALAELVELDGQLRAVVVTPRRVRLVELGGVDAVRRDVASVLFGLRRLAMEFGSPRSLAAARATMDAAAQRIDAAVIAPLGLSPGVESVVVVPTGALHALPWSVLPSLRGRSVSIAPSAAIWARCQAAEPLAGHGVVLAAGPDLPEAVGEVAEVAEGYPNSTVLVGSSATADAVRKALDGAGIAHVAAHGRFRADNPQFSSLQLADGPLTVYDLERMHRAPRLVVLSACDSGRSTVDPGDELMGLAAALLALGTRTLVASLLPVPDVTTRRLMVRLHAHIRAGAPAAAALALAQQEEPGAAAAAFVCIGGS